MRLSGYGWEYPGEAGGLCHQPERVRADGSTTDGRNCTGVSPPTEEGADTPLLSCSPHRFQTHGRAREPRLNATRTKTGDDEAYSRDQHGETDETRKNGGGCSVQLLKRAGRRGANPRTVEIPARPNPRANSKHQRRKPDRTPRTKAKRPRTRKKPAGRSPDKVPWTKKARRFG